MHIIHTCLAIFCIHFQALLIEFTPIRFINERAFRGLDEIEGLYITESRIDRVPSIVDISQSLVSLRIIKSNIVSIPATYFSDCRQLYSFALTHSKLRSFPNLSDVKETLTLLKLSNNYIKNVDLIYGVLFVQLKFLYLDHNRIHHLDLQMLSMPELQDANLTSNLITEMAHPKILALNRTSGHGTACISLEMNDNPWGCPELSSPFKWAIKQAFTHGSGIANTERLVWLGSCVQVINTQALFCRGTSGLQPVETLLVDGAPSGNGYPLPFNSMNRV